MHARRTPPIGTRSAARLLLGEQRLPLDVGREHRLQDRPVAARHLLLDVQNLQVGRDALELVRGEEL
eukprot:6099941-Pleurochrysis_carterae.AAC.1